ncbi:ABC transporter permease [Telmatospirillum sp. J64-1]|uniref:ABC transporter permease n=1 Tax=Telmatospirillum sp. J64-1 TaxID=2502183 RepID=UPI00115E0318|nr:ABC transporter permease [Telmatospirillum sp. J64-1]
MTEIAAREASPPTVPAPALPAGKKKASWKESRLVSPSLLVIVLFLWEALVHLLGIPAIVLPPPSAVLVSLWDGIASGLFLPHFLVTVTEILSGFALGGGIGIILGILIGQSAFLERVIYPYVVAFQTVPKVAIAPIIVVWFGYGLSSKIIITATIAFFPVLANTIVGLQSVPREQLDMLRACTASNWQIFRMARLPQALPFIFVGLDIAIVLSVIGAIVGEFVGARAGLGYLILQKNFTFDMAGVFAILIILSLIGVGLHFCVMFVQRRVLFWADSNKNRITGA